MESARIQAHDSTRKPRKGGHLKSIHSPFEIELVDTPREWIIFGVLALAIFALSLGYEYYKYRALTADERVSVDAQVLLQYTKSEKNYFVLKLKSSDGATFYTTSRDDLRDLRNRYVNLYGKLGEDCSFYRYLRSCFIINFSMSLLPERDYRVKIMDFINAQHSEKYTDESDEFGDNLMGSLYNNLFLATPMTPKWREVSASLGIAHVFAISGFHLSVLSFALYLFLSPFYRILQQRYFTYRNEFYDINLLILIIAFGYLIVLDFSPSFLRSFVMFAFAFMVLFKGLRLVSFRLLLVCSVLILALFPRIFFSIGFWLSVSGVFYIYLFLRHFWKINKWLYLLALNFIVYFNMLIISHYFFYTFSAYQIISPFIAISFVVFYPLALIMHLLGVGGGMDFLLSLMLNREYFNVELQTPLYFLVFFVMSSLVAIFSRYAYYFTLGVSALYFLYAMWRAYERIFLACL